MKKKFLYIIGIALLSSTACQKDKLSPASTSQVVADSQYLPFANSTRILDQVLGLYSNLRSGSFYGARYQVYNEVKCDNWINATANSVTAYQTWTETVTSNSSEVQGLWSQAYFTINNCNLFIDGMAAAGTAVVGTSVATNYIAEAKFIRAASYYALLQFYCAAYPINGGTSAGVPLRLTGNNSYGNYDLAPATVAQVYAQIISDLNDAETGLPLVYADANTNTTRAHRNTAIAFKTRVYLSMGQYTNVITEANKIVSATAPFTATTGVAHALQANIANVFKSPYTTTESILSMPFNTQETVGSQNALADYFGGLASSEFYLNLTSSTLTDPTWKATDARKAFNVVKSGHTYVAKWATGSPYTDWAPVIRYAEVLLNLAEARANVNGVTDPQAIALLNAVRQRSDPTTVFTSATVANILEERNIEFLSEGLRWADLLRLNLPIPAKSSVPQINPTDAPYIWPMSGTEQLYNKLIGR
jgi:hypothetical protein